MNKISIRFFNDKEVRAAWDNDSNRWLFSIVDIVAAITESPRPRVNRTPKVRHKTFGVFYV